MLNYMTYVSSCYLSLTCLQALHPYLFALSTHVAYVTSRLTCCYDLLVFLVTRTLRVLSGFALEVLLMFNKITESVSNLYFVWFLSDLAIFWHLSNLQISNLPMMISLKKKKDKKPTKDKTSLMIISINLKKL